MNTSFALSLLIVATLGTLNCYTCRNKNVNPAAHTIHCSKHAAQDVKKNIEANAHDIYEAAQEDVQHTKGQIQQSPTAQNIKQTGQKIADKSSKTVKVAKDAAQNVGSTVKETATKIGHATKEGALKTGHALQESAQKIGHAITEGALEAHDTLTEAKDKAKHS